MCTAILSMHKLIIYGICDEEFLNKQDHLATTAINKLYNNLDNHQAQLSLLIQYMVVLDEGGYKYKNSIFNSWLDVI